MKRRGRIGWKFRREVSTLFFRVAYALCLRPVEPIINWLYDRYSARLVSLTKIYGAALGERVAVYLLYQPAGVSQITFHTVEMLRRSEFSVVVVSNTKLSRDDTRHLSKNAAVILERPNYGLDFGGYRDALLYLRDQQTPLSELLLLNDSVICVCGDLHEFISRIRHCAEEVISAVELRGGRSEAALLTSYFLFFRRNVLQSLIFWEFWQYYQMANSRYTTVRRGERRLSRMVKTSEFSSRGMVSCEGFSASTLDSLPITELERIIQYCALTDEKFIFQLEGLLRAARWIPVNEVRCTLSEFIKQVSDRRSLVASFPYLAHVILEMPIQKRGSTLLQRLAICRFAEAIDDGVVTGLGLEVAAEILSLKSRYEADPVVGPAYARLAKAVWTDSLPKRQTKFGLTQSRKVD